MRKSIEDEEKLAGKLSDEDQETIEEAVREVIDWLDDNAEAELEDYQEKLKEVEGICNPIVAEIYQQEGGEEDMDEDFDDFDDFDHDEL